MDPTYRVSHLAAYARWREEDESEVGWLINSIISDKPTPKMEKGTAFHKYLEHAQDGVEIDEFSVDGYRFIFTSDIEISLPKIRETRREKNYGGIIVSGCADAIVANTIYDHKTTERFDAENYLEGWQYRFYLDIFGADRFIWNAWEMKEVEEDSKVYEVYGLHQLIQYRYPQMESDCANLAQDFKAFAETWLHGYTFKPEPPKPATSADTHHTMTLNDRLRASIALLGA